MFLKLFSAIILGVRNFRVFEILEHLPYMGLEATKPAFRVSDRARLKSVTSATKTN